MIAYRRGGKYCLRSRPQTVRQTDNTRRSAQWFGAASRKGALIRSAFADELDIPHYGRHVNQLNKRIVHAGRNNHAGLKGFHFNPYTSVNSLFHMPITFSRDGRLHLPPQHFEAIGGAEQLEFKVIGKRIDFTTGRVTGSDTALLMITRDQMTSRYEQAPKRPFEGAELSIDVPGKGTLLVVLQVRVHREDYASCNLKYNAADIIAMQEEQKPEVLPAAPRPHNRLLRLHRARKVNVVPPADDRGTVLRE